MTALTKKDFVLAIQDSYRRQGKELGYQSAKRQFEAFIDLTREQIISLNHVRIKGFGWLGAIFKQGGREVRNPKTGDVKQMHDTFSIRLRTGSVPGRKINASELPALYEEHGLDKKFTETAYKIFVESLQKDVMEQGFRIEIRGFGAFSRRDREARIARNPKTGEPTNAAEKSIIYYRAPKKLTQKVIDRNQL